MRNILIIFTLFVAFTSQADQLAYLSKADAERAATEIKVGEILFMYCGCCSSVEPEKVKVIEVEVKYTGYEDYYEVIVKYEKENGSIMSEGIDLAYVWKKKLFKYKTLGNLLNLEHDSCIYIKDWDDPKNVEKDI